MFASLAIALIMLSFAFDPAIAFKAGGILGLVLSIVLLWFAQTAHRRPPKHTETWLLLEVEYRPDNDRDRRLFAAVLEEVYLYFSARAFAVAISFLAIGLLLSLIVHIPAR